MNIRSIFVGAVLGASALGLFWVTATPAANGFIGCRNGQWEIRNVTFDGAGVDPTKFSC